MNHVTFRFFTPCALAAVTVFASACGGAGTTSDSDISSTASAVSGGNEETAYKFFVAKGLKDFQAAGIVGNLIQESGVDPTISQYGGGPGRGIAQWSEGGRWNDGEDSVEWYASHEGQSMYSLNLQLEFIWDELTKYGYGYSELRDSTTLSEAEFAFQDRYEECGECDQATRVEYAQQVLSAFGGGGGDDACELGGKKYAARTCTETKQCDNGAWVARDDDPSTCLTGIEAHGACITDSGAVDAENTCTSTLQCDNGVWVDRSDDPTDCR